MKPSERIKELTSGRITGEGPTQIIQYQASDFVEGIMKYLDEQWEKGANSPFDPIREQPEKEEVDPYQEKADKTRQEWIQEKEDKCDTCGYLKIMGNCKCDFISAKDFEHTARPVDSISKQKVLKVLEEEMELYNGDTTKKAVLLVEVLTDIADKVKAL